MFRRNSFYLKLSISGQRPLKAFAPAVVVVVLVVEKASMKRIKNEYKHCMKSSRNGNKSASEIKLIWFVNAA